MHMVVMRWLASNSWPSFDAVANPDTRWRSHLLMFKPLRSCQFVTFKRSPIS